ncbi:oligosaccharide flippase family protein, partial [Photobacterium kishitanii]
MLKNSLSSFIVTILATILSFFVSVLLSHKLNVVDFGIVQFYLSSVLFMSVISRLGFDLIFIKYWKEYDSFKKQDLIFITSIVILLLSILFSLLFFFYYKLDISIG